MPSIVERALIHGDVSVDPYLLLDRIDMSTSERVDAETALNASDAVITQTVLSAIECSKLRTFVEDNIVNDGIDDVDGCPGRQVNLSLKKLTKSSAKRL